MSSYDFSPDELAAAGALYPVVDPGYSYPSDPLVAARLEHWRDLKFGVIIHWGIYSTIGQGGSWSLHRERLGGFTDAPSDWRGSDAQYHSWYCDQARGFDGVDFDARQWARVCAAAGMRYAVFTAKHHDGFCLYDSDYTNFKATSEECGLGRDVFAEFVTQFRAVGLETGVYFSKADWSRPEYWDRGRAISDRFANYPIASHPRKWQRFVDFTQDQIVELLSKYGEMLVLWLDAGWVREPEEPIGIDEIARLARQLQPGILVVDREVHGPHENYRTPEQEVPEAVLDMPWESCITLTRSWCSLMRDDVVKPTWEVIETLLAVVSRGGNLLLGVGPDATGQLSAHISDAMEEIGSWVRAYESVIFGSRALSARGVSEFGGVRASVRGEDVPVYFVSALGGDVVGFVFLKDEVPGVCVEVTGVPRSCVVVGVAGEVVVQDSLGGVSVTGKYPYACGFRLRSS